MFSGSRYGVASFVCKRCDRARHTGQAGVPLCRRPAVCQRIAQLAQQLQPETEVVLCLGELGLQRDRLPVLADGKHDLPRIEQRHAEVVMRLGVIGLQSQRLTVLLDGRIALADIVQRDAEVVVGLGGIRVQPEGFAVLLDGLVSPACLVVLEPLLVVGFKPTTNAPRTRRKNQRTNGQTRNDNARYHDFSPLAFRAPGCQRRRTPDTENQIIRAAAARARCSCAAWPSGTAMLR